MKTAAYQMRVCSHKDVRTVTANIALIEERHDVPLSTHNGRYEVTFVQKQYTTIFKTRIWQTTTRTTIQNSNFTYYKQHSFPLFSFLFLEFSFYYLDLMEIELDMS